MGSVSAQSDLSGGLMASQAQKKISVLILIEYFQQYFTVSRSQNSLNDGKKKKAEWVVVANDPQPVWAQP